MARPKKPFSLHQVQRLARIGCTQEEIAYTLAVSVDTLTRTQGFAEAYKRGEAGGKQSLRHKQHQVAEGGSVPMLIWLGKNRLGQKDNIVTEHSGEMTVTDGSRDRLISKLFSGVASRATDEGDPLVN